jgi:hypothetical protein
LANGNTTPSRLGQINVAGDPLALFLKVYAGEVLTSFDNDCVMKPLVRTRTISAGKSAQFPVLGRNTAKYHVVGENIADAGNTYLNTVGANEKVISIDGALVSANMVANWDEMVNHYDIRSEYAMLQGNALAQKFDKQHIQLAVLAARTAANIGGASPGGPYFGGTAITDAAIHTSAAVLLAKLLIAAQTLDEKSVPRQDRHAVLSPAMYWLLVGDKSLVNQDFGGGANGVFYDGTIFKAAGFSLHVSNNIPSGVVAAETGQNNTYSGDFTKTKGVCFHRSAIGCVKRADLAFEKEYKIELQGTLMVAKYVMGSGILRPEAAIELAIP